MADKRTNEQIDRINKMRELQGETPLPYESDDAGSETEEAKTIRLQKEEDAKKYPGLDEAGIIAAKKKEEDDAETERIRLEKESKNNDVKVEINDESVLAYLKSKGKEVSSLDEILNPKTVPTEADIEKEKEQRESNKISYALKEGKFSDKELKAYFKDANDPQELVFSQYLAEQLKEDDTLTEDEIRTEFESKYGLDQKEGSRQFKRGQTELSLLADNLLRSKHSKVINFDNEYNQIETAQLSEKQTQQKVLSQAPIYKKDVEDVYNDLKKITVSFGGKNFEIPVEQSILDKQKTVELSEDYAVNKIRTGYTKEKLKENALAALILENLPTFMQNAAEQYHQSIAAGAHGIPPLGEKDKVDAKTTERKETLKKYHGESVTAAATN